MNRLALILRGYGSLAFVGPMPTQPPYLHHFFYQPIELSADEALRKDWLTVYDGFLAVAMREIEHVKTESSIRA